MLLLNELISVLFELLDLLLFLISKLNHNLNFSLLFLIVRNDSRIVHFKLLDFFHRLVNSQIDAIELLLHPLFDCLQ